MNAVTDLGPVFGGVEIFVSFYQQMELTSQNTEDVILMYRDSW